MEKITIFCGKRDTGKTLEAKKIASNYKNDEVIWISGRTKKMTPFFFYSCTQKTKLIIIDDLSESLYLDFEKFFDCYSEIRVNKPYENSFSIQPKIIFITNNNPNSDNESFKRRFNLKLFP